MKKRTLVLGFSFILFCAVFSQAHPGPINSDGGHYDIVTKKYHYHKNRIKQKGPGYLPRGFNNSAYQSVPQSNDPTSSRNYALVTNVIDGNTVLVKINGKQEKIRFTDLVAPNADLPKGKACKTYLQDMITSKVVVVTHKNIRDKNGCLLGDIYWNGLSVSRAVKEFIQTNK